MDYTVKNWLVIVINSSKELVMCGVDISKKFFPSFEEAKDYIDKKSKSYKQAKKIDLEESTAYIECDDYFVQMEIIDCSKTIKITG